MMRSDPASGLSDRDFRFALEQYALFSNRATELQKEREAWIRHSILATFAFLGWLAVYRDNVTDTFMLDMFSLQTIYFVPLVFNIGGALRFVVLQRDLIRLGAYLMQMESDILGIDICVREAPHRRAIGDRSWHVPSILYWTFIIALSGLVGVVLTFHVQL